MVGHLPPEGVLDDGERTSCSSPTPRKVREDARQFVRELVNTATGARASRFGDRLRVVQQSAGRTKVPDLPLFRVPCEPSREDRPDDLT